MRTILILLSYILSAAASAASWSEAVARYQAAQASGDSAAVQDALAAALALRPDYPRLMLGLADLHASQGRDARACNLLGQLAGQGLAFDVDRRAGLAPIATAPCLAELRTRFAANATPRPSGTELLRIDAPRLVPEGHAYDARRRVRYLGGVHEPRILRVDASGRVRDLVPAGRDGLRSVIGLALDQRRGLLWATSSDLPETAGHDPAQVRPAELLAFRSRDGKLMARHAAPPDARMFGDLVLDDAGTPYVSDPLGGRVYRLDEGELRPLTAPGALASPQGLVITADGSAVVVADYAQGLMRIALADGAVERVRVPALLNAYGVDGLVREGARVVAVQNGVAPQRVLALDLSADGRAVTRWDLLARADERWSEPTVGVLHAGRFQFFGNSQWDRFDPQSHALRTDPPLTGPLLLEIALP